ncbi:MAG: hypothetical protein JNJ89_07635 [Rubrivivax sp.]|nr:hypothetical protein [Rubrivivax sp.]
MRWSSHASDLPQHWKGPLRRAFNVRANELVGVNTEAGPLLRAELRVHVESFERSARPRPTAERTAAFIAEATFADLFEPRRLAAHREGVPA